VTKSAPARTALAIALGLSVAVAVLPFGGLIGWPLMMLHTFVHELGHGVGGLLAGGSFDKLVLFWRGGGTAYTSGVGGDFGRLLVLTGGLVGPAVAGAVFFVLAMRPRLSRMGLVCAGLTSLLALLLVVRSSAGVAIALGFGLLFLALARGGSPVVQQSAAAFVAVQLSMSVFSRGDYLFMSGSFTHGDGTEMVTDIQKVADILGVPVLFGGLVMGGFSVVVVALGALAFWRQASSGSSPQGVR
jgi:hypothetical protein